MIEREPLQVLITVDTEIWCDDWAAIDRQFDDAFARYIHGRTPEGEFGLPYQLRTLRAHDLRAVYFVEPLFAARFGQERLAEIVALVHEGGQPVELHLHTEWVDEAIEPLLAAPQGKRQHLNLFSGAEQRILIAAGADLLTRAGAGPLRAFRAGNFGANDATLPAVAANGIGIDSSYHAASPHCAIEPAAPMQQPRRVGGVIEFPVSCFGDGLGRVRPASLNAASAREIAQALQDAWRQGWRYFVIVMHSFDLLDRHRRHANPIALRRFHGLIEFLARNRDRFRTTDFGAAPAVGGAEVPLRCGLWPTLGRIGEQMRSRLA
ncbi:MAG: polysaccharide deacetylase [Gammaproteobacteria bacterium]